MAVTIKSLQAPKAAELIAAQLRRQIVSGELKEGDALPSESALMDQFGVSRPTLREAIRVLESERIVRVKRGNRGGAYVLVPQSAVAGRYTGTLLQYQGATMADLHEARAQLESACVGVLAQKRTAADLRELDTLLAAGEELRSDPIAYGEKHELQFHRRLVELAGNQTMVVLLDMLFSIVEMQNRSYMKSHPVDESQQAAIRASHRAHVKVVDLIRAKSSEEAVALWHKHLTLISELVTGPGEVVLDILP
ncbi:MULTISPECIES: FadR/GntR family transcriptional regulator [Mycolicibacter]|uniref:FadR family transcriptional regulator n=1 Tax=Mycolicibacter kumamotonensis TaxID=354243 RepID=A0A7K3L6K8_9MYCO|nr:MULTISPECIES: FadR/GntR family transcriptional regulator [Mycolicibacter]NDJ88025.1 FadR family transcriptional regulator [Mycolicibacter kumamotonensis]RAV02837.1 GntR family transcriptional regulator [Mycolicibacter senuensis]